MNRYFENGVARQERAKTVKEAKYFFECTCEGWYDRQGLHHGGCYGQGTCEERRCPVYLAHTARVEYLNSGIQNIPLEFVEKEETKKKKQVLSLEYRAKKAVVHYLDFVAKKAICLNHRKMAIDLENCSVQIYVVGLAKAMNLIKKKYPEIYYEAGRRYQKYLPFKKEVK